MFELADKQVLFFSSVYWLLVCLTHGLIFLTAYDLPLRPNEAHIFYGNMSKVVVSLLGRTKSTDREEKDNAERLMPSARRGSETHGYYCNIQDVVHPKKAFRIPISI